MFKRLLASAIFAGFAAGLIATLLQITMLVPLILEAELYESGSMQHFATAEGATIESHAGHDHSHEPEAPGLARTLQTGFFTVVTFTAYGLVMVALFGLAERSGRKIDARAGLLWGLAGFASVQLATAAGLPPELPGNGAAALELRQIWWLATAVVTAAGIALIALSRKAVFVAAGLALVAVPHLLGAPHPESFSGVAPPEVASLFVSRSLASTAVAWIVLGLVAGYFWSRAPET